MADEVSDVNIEKGVHLSVIVEFCAQNVIVVCLKSKGKEFRGVLLESDGGFFPFSFPFLKSHPSSTSEKSAQKADSSGPVKNGPSAQPDAADKTSPPTPEVPATTQRFSYNNDPFLVNPIPKPELTVVEMKPIAPRTKTIRDIRLRPRQTLCSNCKSAIHEGRKTRSNSSSHSLSNQSKTSSTVTPPTTPTVSTADSRLRPRVNGSVTQISPLKHRPPKRRIETQTPMVLLEDIKHKTSRFSTCTTVKDQKQRSGNSGAAENQPSHTNNKTSFESSVKSLTKTTNRLRANRRSLLLETNINHESNVQLNDPDKDDHSDLLSLKAGKKSKLSNHEPSLRPSPAIKISIKGGAILKIPPRLPDSESPSLNNTSDTDVIQRNDINALQIHKKAKKSAKKAKDRHRIFDSGSGLSVLPNGDQALSKALKKHKKKHRHRHQSPESTEERKTFSRLLNTPSAFNVETGNFAHSKEADNFNRISSQESNSDIFPRENDSSCSVLQEAHSDSFFKQEPSNLSTYDSSTYDRRKTISESVNSESFHSNLLLSSDINKTDTFRRDLSPMNISMSGLNNNNNTNTSAIGRDTSNINIITGFSGPTESTNLCRETPVFESFTSNANTYMNMNFSRDSASLDKFSQASNASNMFRHVENNNVVAKTEEHVSNMMSNFEPNFSPFDPSGNLRQLSSPMQQKQIRVGDCFIDVVDISDSDSDNEVVQGSIPSLADPPNFLNPPLNKNEDLDNSRPRLLYTWRQDQGLSRVESDPPLLPRPPPPPPPQHPLSYPFSSPSSLPRPSLPPPPPPLVPAASVPISDDLSPRYLVKTSPSVLPPNANSPHRRKNASPGRVVNASPNVQFSTTNSPLVKDYPLRNRTGSLSTQPTDLLMIAEHGGIVPVSEDSQSHSSGLESHFSDISGESDEDGSQLEDIFAPCGDSEPLSVDEDDKNDLSKPLMLKIQTQNVTECVLNGGRIVRVGDIVWGKIQGCPWWPGRVTGITVTQTQRDNNIVMDQLANVAWFGSNTMSHVHCCDLDPFLEFFKSRYNKKKKGPYKLAIKQATQAAQKLANGISRSDILDFTN